MKALEMMIKHTKSLVSCRPAKSGEVPHTKVREYPVYGISEYGNLYGEQQMLAEHHPLSPRGAWPYCALWQPMQGHVYNNIYRFLSLSECKFLFQFSISISESLCGRTLSSRCVNLKRPYSFWTGLQQSYRITCSAPTSQNRGPTCC